MRTKVQNTLRIVCVMMIVSFFVIIIICSRVLSASPPCHRADGGMVRVGEAIRQPYQEHL